MLEAAGRLIDRYADGVWLAELAPLGDPSQIPSEVARALGAPEVPGVPAIATVTAFVADKELLLLLDNAEHLVDGVARVRRTAARERAGPAHPHDEPRGAGRPGRGGPPAAVPVLPGGRALADPAVLGVTAADLEGAAATEAVRLFTERATSVDPGVHACAIPMSRRSSRSASGSTASRWRSSSRQRACRPCRPTTSPCAWATGSACWPAVAGRPSRASRRSTR